MKENAFKVLFVYPGLFMQTALPLGLASLVATLKKRDVDVKVFDTILYREKNEIDENEERAETHHSTKKLDYNSVDIIQKHSDMIEDFTAFLRDYQPDLIGLNAVESTFARGIRLTRAAKQVRDIPIIAGGVFPTLAPETVLDEPSIDMVCVGEGEDLISNLVDAMASGLDYASISGLWLKKNGSIVSNPIRELKPLDAMIEPDFSCFNNWMFYKPMQGNLFKTIPVELSRGCPYPCTYCSEPALKRQHKEFQQSYFRIKSIPKLLQELTNLRERYAPEFFYFATETFLAMRKEEFEAFIDGYRQIGIPFWIQTRPETVSYEKIRKLQDVGLFWLTIGIECGNEEYRKKHLKRAMSNDTIIQAVQMLADCGQGVSLNSIIGFPFETRELMLETVLLNRKLFHANNRVRANISIFTPFRGCELHEVCIKNGLMEYVPYLSNTNISGLSVIKFTDMSAEELAGLYRALPLYIYLTDEYLERIPLAEQFTEAGNQEHAALNKLVSEYLI